MPSLKVACLFKPNGEYYRLSGFGNALKLMGHDFIFWNPQKPIMDLFDEYRPDIFIGTTFDLQRSWVTAFKAHPQIKVVLKGGNWGENDDKIDKARYPIVFASDREKKAFELLKKETGKPDLVMCHYHPNKVPLTMGLWESIGIKPVGIMNAADTTLYFNGVSKPHLESDVAFIGGYWPYKAQNLDKYIVPLCSPSSNLNVKIFGNQRWHVANYCGMIRDEDVKDVYRSAKVCPNVSEPHAVDLGFDVCERPFQVIASGGVLLMDEVDSAKEVFGSSLVYYKDQKDYGNLLKEFTKNPSSRPNMDKAKSILFEGNTYYHRMKSLLLELGY